MSQENPEEAKAFQHARHIGEHPVVPHSLKDQVKKGKHNANVLDAESQKKAESHQRDHTLLLTPEEDENF